MKIRVNSKISFGVTISTSVALIIIGAFLVKYQIDPSGSLFFLVGIIITLFGFIFLLDLIAGRRKGATIADFFISIAILIVGILIAIFSEPIQAIGLLAIGAVFVFFFFCYFISAARNRSAITLVFGILRAIIGVAFFLTGTGEALTSGADKEVVKRIWQIIGYISIAFGTTFLVLETFEGQD